MDIHSHHWYEIGMNELSFLRKIPMYILKLI